MKLMKNISLALVFVVALAACGKKSTDELAKKQEELTKKQEKLSTLQSEISTLEKEIAELDTTPRDNALPVMVMEIANGEFKNPFQVQGLVESNQNVMVSPEVPANVSQIHVVEGQRVSKGQIIASLDGSIAGAQIKELENALSLAKINFEKQERLWKKKIGSEMQYLQAKNQYENLQKSLETAQTQLGKYTLRSPINGTVDAIMANPGELVGGMTSGPVARIVNLRDIKIKANVSERYVGQIKAGQVVKVRFPSLGIETEEKVAAVSNVIDINNRTFVAYIKPSKNLDLMKPNLLALITAYDFVQTEAISIPTKLVRNDGTDNFVYTVKSTGSKKEVQKTIIEIEKQFPDETVVKSGLAPGDLIITEGVNSVIVGDQVKIIEK